MIASAVRNDDASASGVTSVRSSAEEWYWGKRPCGVRDSVPTGRSKPGEQYCRSSPPLGCQSVTMLPGSRASTYAEARSTGASPRRLRLYRSGPGSPTHDTTSPWRTRSSVSKLRASQQSGPRVPGLQSRRYVWLSRCCPSVLASAHRTTMPERLSLASAGWQTYVLRRNSASRRAGDGHLARGQRAVLEAGVDDDPVVTFLERLQLPPAHAEAPLLLPVRGAIRDQVGIVAVREDMAAKLVEGEHGVDRRAVAEDVEGGVGNVDDAVAARPVDPRRAESPFSGNDPVEDLRSRRRLDDLERDVAAEDGERVADTVPGQAPGDREELAHQLDEFLADGLGGGHGIPVDWHSRKRGSPGR